MTKAYIKGISYYLPSNIVSNEQLAADFPEWSAEKVASKVGIQKRHIAGANETATDMAFKAGMKFFEEYPSVDKSSIDFILLCTQSPDYFLPTSACVLQHLLGLSTSCGALDFNLGCSGFVYGLSLAKGLLCAGIAKNILLITTETYSKYIHPSDKGNRTIFGDAAAATLISNNGFAEIGRFSLGTDGRGAENLIVKSGAARQPQQNGNLSVDCEGNEYLDDFLYMNGTEIFNFTLGAVPSLVEDTLKVNQLAQSDINLFIFHQANKHMLNFLRKKLKIDEEHFVYCMENTGNTVSSTIPIALKETQVCNKIHSGDKVLLAGFGVGYSWGGVVLNF